MTELKLEKKIIIFLLLNKNNVFADSYSLIKALSRWFDIINYNELLNELIKDRLIEKELKNQLGYYTVNKETKELFKKSKKLYIDEFKTGYPNQAETIDMLSENLL